MAGRISLALAAADEAAPVAAVGSSIGNREAVPAAFGVVRLAGGDPWHAALIAANVGDDTDTIAAMARALGWLDGLSIPASARKPRFCGPLRDL